MRAWYTCTLFPAMLGALLCAPRLARAQGAPSSDPTPNETGDAPVMAEELPVEEPAPEQLDPTRPPPAGKGAVWGTVKSKKDGETVLEALVTVIGRKEYATTDVEGRYRLELPPGTYQLRVVYELHRPARVKNVRVVPGRVGKVDVRLDPDETAVEEVTAVEAEVERASAATQLFLRKNAAQASDSIGAQDIAKAPDRNAADAVKRVVGTTVVDGRYIFVRGLGDRYTNTMLNGSPMPSPEPDRQAVPLDMFPSLVISDLTISKTFVPDMPGDFTGGSLNIHTRDLPNKFLFQATVGLGFNTVSTFGHRLSYPGGSTDWLGMDDGGRKLPSSVPKQRVTELTPDGRLNPNLTAVGKAINSPMETERAFNLPHGTASVVIGDSFKLKKGQFLGCDGCVLGYMVGGTYSRRFTKRTDEVIRTYTLAPGQPGGLGIQNDYTAETGTDTVTWSGLGSVSYAIGTDHKISLTGLYSRNSEKEGRIIRGTSLESGGAEVYDERLRFVNRSLAYGQLRGEHRFRSLNAAQLQWTALYARAALNDPNLRESVYSAADGSGALSYREGTQSGQHFYAAQSETTRSGGLDWTQPLTKGENATKLKGGALVTLRGRSFNARRFRFVPSPDITDPLVLRERPNVLFQDANIGPVLQVDEWTRPTDSYAAQYNVYAGYLMADIALSSKIRVVAGERLEAARQIVQSFDPFSPSDRVNSALNKTDLLPSGNIIFKATETTNIRLSATRTVARPQLRELAPFVFSDFFGAREILGNPNLDRTRVLNFDARIEIFPRVGEVLALSVFHKRFDKPIEPVILPTSRGVLSYANALGAINTGVEIEGRKSLDFIRPWLKDFGVVANLTLVHSSVELDPAAGGTQTSQSRPLAGQSPYVVNAALDYGNDKSKTRARILYNVSGPRVAQVGLNGIPDIYEQPRHLVDLSVAQGIGEHIDLKATAENLLNAPVRFIHGNDSDLLVSRYLLGTTFWLTATYTN